MINLESKVHECHVTFSYKKNRNRIDSNTRRLNIRNKLSRCIIFYLNEEKRLLEVVFHLKCIICLVLVLSLKSPDVFHLYYSQKHWLDLNL